MLSIGSLSLVMVKIKSKSETLLLKNDHKFVVFVQKYPFGLFSKIFIGL